MPISDEEMIVSTTDYFTSENKLNPKASAVEIADFVRKCKTTGIVTTTTVNSGGVQGVVVTERKRLDDTESNDVRRALGMDYEVEADGDEDEDEDDDDEVPLVV